MRMADCSHVDPRSTRRDRDLLPGNDLDMVRDAVRAYVVDNIAPHAAAWDRASTFPADALKGLPGWSGAIPWRGLLYNGAWGWGTALMLLAPLSLRR